MPRQVVEDVWQRLRLNGQHDHVGALDSLAVVRRSLDPAAFFEGLAASGLRVAGNDRVGGGQPLGHNAGGDYFTHYARADECDTHVLPQFCLSPKMARPMRTIVAGVMGEVI